MEKDLTDDERGTSKADFVFDQEQHEDTFADHFAMPSTNFVTGSGPEPTLEISATLDGSDLLPVTATDDGALIERMLAALAANTAETSLFHERMKAYEDNARVMHAQIEKLQQDQVRVLLKPAFERLTALHAQANDIVDQKQADDPDAAGDFRFFAESIEDILGLYDLESVSAAVGMPFDPKKHQASRAIKTDDVALDATLQKVIRQGFGFAAADRVLLPARVSVYRYQKPSELPSTSSAEDERGIEESTPVTSI
ncbi:nucleotide exchange factor GrpE [Glutamicibacter sp. NPDC087344]|uniref:nucleotide exchange factor GrpE n=1 Tax=Glutamicibacter sp. NPDC087344 TaxID=3363994 RepID=UPI0038218079